MSGYGGGVNIHFYDANKGYLGNVATYTNATFTTPQNAHFMRFVSWTYQAYGNDITVSLYYSGESGYDQYYPYTVLAEVDTGSEVLRSAGAIADEKTPDGTITRRVGVVDLGTLSWNYSSSAGQEFFYTSITGAKSKAWGTLSNAACPPYMQAAYDDVNGQNGMFGINPAGNTFKACNTSYSDAATFKTAMSGVYLYYELATPTTEQGTAFAENIPCDDFGSMYWTQTKGIPQGNEIFYPTDLKGALDSIVAALPSAIGTYTLHATVTTAGVTFSWS